MTRWTSYIEKPDALKLPKVALKSKEIGFRLNLYVTINLEDLGFDVLHCQYQWRILRQRLKRFLEKHNLPFVCLWVFENSSSNGVHVHSLIYWGNLTKADIRNALNLPHSTQETVKLEWLYAWNTWEQNIDNLVNYFLKGINPAHDHLIKREAISQGAIAGKRVSWTRNLKPKP